jgi:hypothetical protein
VRDFRVKPRFLRDLEDHQAWMTQIDNLISQIVGAEKLDQFPKTEWSGHLYCRDNDPPFITIYFSITGETPLFEWLLGPNTPLR